MRYTTIRPAIGLAMLGCALAAAAQPRSLLVLGQEFLGRSSDFRFHQTELSADQACMAGSPEHRAEARLLLPDGARLMSWRAWLQDQLPEGDMRLELVERCRDENDPATVAVTTLGALQSSGAGPASVLEQALAAQPAVDAARCTYVAVVDYGIGNGVCSGFNRTLFQVRVDYEEAQPPAPRGRVSLDGTALRREQHENTYLTRDDGALACAEDSPGAYFTTRVPLPDRAVPLRVAAWFENDDPIWAGDAHFRVLCRDGAQQVTTRQLATLLADEASGATLQIADLAAVAPVDQRHCALYVFNSAAVGDPCVSSLIRYGRVRVDYVVDPVFADPFDTGS